MVFPNILKWFTRSTKTAGLGAYSDFWYNVAGSGTKSGTQVSEKSAMKYLTVARCVMLISADLARLPLNLYRKSADGGKEIVLDHPLYNVLHTEANSEINSLQYRQAANGHIELWGNHYGRVKRNNLNQVIALFPVINPGAVDVKRNERGKLIYKWRDPGGKEYAEKKENMFHVPGFGFNGVVGLSIINIIREAVGLGIANDEFASRYFGQGMNIGAVMNIPQELGEGREAYLASIKKEYAGMKNSHGILITQNDETFTPLSMPLRDAQFLEGREFQKQEIAGFYGVPGHKVGIYQANTNRNNTEQENQGYLDSCLIHRITRYETCINQQLLSKEDRRSGLFAEFNVAGLLRADSQARAEYYNKIFQVGGISPNEIRAKENWNPDPNPAADQKYVMLNMVPLDMAGKAQELKKPEEKAIRSLKENRSIQTRDRITRQFYPLFFQAAERIVNLEGNAVKNKVAKFRKLRAVSDMESWLDDFYNGMPDKIKRELGPVIKSFSDAIIEESMSEMGLEDVDLDKFVNDYIDTYALRHTSSSLGQLRALLKDGIDELEVRVDEWREKRPEKIATNETTRSSNAFYQAVAFSAGLSTVWRIRGAKTCPFCKSLSGKRVSSGQVFVNDGEDLNPEGAEAPMKIRGMKTHPPLHRGCDCYLSTI